MIHDNRSLALKNSVYDELTREHADLLTGLYMLAFSSYDGFENFINR
ncbi:MAG: hypothetical protein NC117_02100 [Pseudoflavonifractor sp.]|nr:hypothetical protein [Pseudoflavonifractor sp.]